MNTEKISRNTQSVKSKTSLKSIKIKERASAATQGLFTGALLEIFSTKTTYYD